MSTRGANLTLSALVLVGVRGDGRGGGERMLIGLRGPLRTGECGCVSARTRSPTAAHQASAPADSDSRFPGVQTTASLMRAFVECWRGWVERPGKFVGSEI
ncbi:hypothetical protein B0H19DRAFT_1117732 [Mycena capillaripes]|nr:hypothetical protein B0H19DRAFT_1117732 [Mycena capillaripes]